MTSKERDNLAAASTALAVSAIEALEGQGIVCLTAIRDTEGISLSLRTCHAGSDSDNALSDTFLAKLEDLIEEYTLSLSCVHPRNSDVG